MKFVVFISNEGMFCKYVINFGSNTSDLYKVVRFISYAIGCAFNQIILINSKNEQVNDIRTI